jgi:lysophospholipase L1-like esterase
VSNRVLVSLGITLSVAFLASAQPAPSASGTRPVQRVAASSTQPAVKDAARHEQFLQIAKKGTIDLLFVGDSITDAWRNTGKAVWDKSFGTMKAENFGIGGDRTEHVLWRMQNGELEGYKAKLVVLMIGTNNLQRDTNEQIADGVALILKEIRQRQPQAKVLLLGMFPRNARAADPYRQRIKDTNGLIQRLADNAAISYMDIGDKFLTPAGDLPTDVMPDALHPSAKGYQIWADAIGDKVKELMK